MVSSVSEKFWRSIAAIRDDIIARVKPVRGTVDELVDGKIILVRAVNDPEDRDEAEYPRIKGFNVNVGEDVYALALGDGQQLLVLVTLQNSVPTLYSLDANLDVAGNIEAGAITGSSFNSPHVQVEAQSSSDAASTTSTVNYSTALTGVAALPSGTWSVHASGGVSLLHSTGGTVNMQIAIDGDLGTARSVSVDSSVYQQVISEHQLSGRTGTINITVRFKSSTAGTTNSRNPWLIIIARRTS
jgi:hypothetical protein